MTYQYNQIELIQKNKISSKYHDTNEIQKIKVDPSSLFLTKTTN